MTTPEEPAFNLDVLVRFARARLAYVTARDACCAAWTPDNSRAEVASVLALKQAERELDAMLLGGNR